MLSKKMGFVLMESKCEESIELNFRRLLEKLKAKTTPVS